MQTTTISHAKLRLSDSNVRKGNAEVGLEALAASIGEHGLLQPLIVSPAKGRKALYDIHAGGRRWRAIGLLIERGALAKDHVVDVRLCGREDAASREISLAENLIREAMTPADEARAYADIISAGADAEAVARRFGVTARHVQGRLRLADLAEPVFAALAAGDITLDVAMAYGSISDRDRQQAAWERFSTGWQCDNAQAIRRAIAEEALCANHPIALFLGEGEYVGCGGRIERDLFAGEGEGLWLDGDLAKELALKKLNFEAEIAALGSRLGWVKPCLATHVGYEETKDLHAYWPRRAEPSVDAAARMLEISQRIEGLIVALDEPLDDDELSGLEAEHDALEAEYERLEATEYLLPDEDKPNVGTFLVLGKDGKSQLLATFYTTAKPARSANTAGIIADVTASGETDAPADVSLPRSLEEQMAKDRRDVLALHLAQDPALALDLAIFSLARDMAGHFGTNQTGCTIRVGDRHEPMGLTGIPISPVATELETIRSLLPNDWAREEDSFAAFLAFRALNEDTRACWLAYAVSQSMKASLASGVYASEFQAGLGELVGVNIARHWRPGAENFFDRIKKSQILGILGQFDAELPGRYATAKKAELASAASRLCAGDAITEPSVKARALAWVPDAMRFGPTGNVGLNDGTGVIDHDIASDAVEPPCDAANQNDALEPVSAAA